MIIPRNNDHIFNSIIGLSPIDMMNYVIGGKASIEVFSHYKTMLTNIAILISHCIKWIISLQQNYSISIRSLFAHPAFPVKTLFACKMKLFPITTYTLVCSVIHNLTTFRTRQTFFSQMLATFRFIISLLPILLVMREKTIRTKLGIPISKKVLLAILAYTKIASVSLTISAVIGGLLFHYTSILLLQYRKGKMVCSEAVAECF